MLRGFMRKIRILSLGAILCISVYLIARVFLFSYSNYGPPEKFISLLLLLGELYMLVHALGFMLNILALSRPRRRKAPWAEIEPGLEPSVAIVVTARHEPKEVLEGTIVTLRNLTYPNKHIYFLDDSSEQAYKDMDDALARDHGIKIFRRATRHGDKAGIVNDFLRGMTEKYIALFDADQNPMPDFLNDLVPILEGDERLAFVQTPQFYTNIGESPVAKGAAMQQAIFYETICEGKNDANCMFCCGTNVIFRREALLDVGGFQENFITEDFATSLDLHMKGWRSWYHNHVVAFGLGPETLPAYFKQQGRWAGGTISVLRKLLLCLSADPSKLSVAQWWEYLLAGTYYFLGWAFLFLMICPIVYLLFGVPSFFLYPQIYISTYIPYFCVTMMIFFGTMKDRYYNFKQIYYGLILAALCFPFLIKASVYGLLGKRMTFVITPKGRPEVMPRSALWPYAAMIGLNIAALAAGAVRFRQHPCAVGMQMFWVSYHLFLLWNIFYFNQLPVPGREEKAKWSAAPALPGSGQDRLKA